MGETRQVWTNESLFPSWYSAEQTQSLQEAAPEEYPKGTGNVPIPSRARSPALPSVAMAQLWLTPFRDVPQVLVPTCGPEITKAELSNCPPVIETHAWQNQQTLLKEELPSGTGQRALENAILLDALPGITKIKPELGLACSGSSCILPLLSRASSEQL